MPETFDPYHRWLGIPPEKQPPNHYVLLALEPFEDSPDVIESAADRQMAHLRTFQSGQHSELSQKLLNEVAAAKVCLLKPEQKAAYDLELDLKLEAEEAQTEAAKEAARAAKLQRAVPLEAAPAPVAPEPVETAPARPAVQIGPALRRTSAAEERSMANLVKILAAGAGGVLLLLIVLIRAFSSSGEALLAFDWPEDQRDRAALKIDGHPVTMAAGGPIEHSVEPGEHRIVATRLGFEPFEWTGAVDAGENYPIKPVWKESPPPPPELVTKPGDDDRLPKPDGPSPDPSEPPPTEPPVVVEDPTVPQDPPKPGPDEPEPPLAVEDPGTVEPPEPVPAKPAIPPDEAQAAVLKQLEEVYQLSKARKPEENLKLAKELYALGRKADNLDERFVLLRKAMELAQGGGDAALMLGAIDAIAADFEVDAWRIKQSMLAKFAGGAKDSKKIGSFVAASGVFIDEAKAAERYDLALDVATLACRTCQQSAGRQYRKQTHDHRQEAQEFYDEHQKLASVLAAIEANPDDGPANLFLGQMYCFTRGDWPRGLPHLAKGSDADLKALAMKELKGATSHDEEVALGDGWWELAENDKGIPRKQMILRSVHWYRQAAAELEGLAKARVERRIASTQETVTRSDAKPKTTATKRTVIGRVFAGCDDEFVMYVNGKEILANRGSAVAIKDHAFSKGDVITVRARNFRGAKGFCCVIRFETGGGMASGPDWRTYTPKSEVEWFLPDNIGKTYPVSHSGGTGWARRVQTAAGFKAPPIWGTGNPCYLVLKIE